MSSGDDVRKKLLRKKKVEQAMEFAFDDDIKNFRKVIEEVKDGIDVPIDPVPNQSGQKQDSFLGEAACGNAVEIVKYCLEKGADVNYVGQHNRTPLQRAILNAADGVILPLLEAGADMRLLVPQERGEDGGIVFREWDPNDLNGLDCDESILKILKGWDFKKTLALLDKRANNQSSSAQAKAEQDARLELEFRNSATSLKDEYDAAMTKYKAAVELREVRIMEYDRSKCEGRHHVLDIAERLIKDAEKDVEELKTKVSVLEMKYKGTEAKLRQHQVAMQGGIKYDVDVTIGQLEDVIIADVGGHMAEKGKVVPLVIDPSGNGFTFLTYRNVLLIDIANSHHMHPLQLRLNILGCLRFGKPLLINLRDKPLGEALATLESKCESCHPGLYKKLVLEKSIKDPKEYEALINDEVEKENAELTKKRFTPFFTEKFVVALISQQQYPEESCMKGFYSVFVTS